MFKNTIFTDVKVRIYLSISNSYPTKLTFSPCFFNREEYILNIDNERFIFSILIESACKAFLILFIKGANAISPFRAPYGSFEFDSNTHESELNTLTEEILVFCKNKGLKTITITSYPDCYDIHKSLMIRNVLLENGFSISITELNYHVPIDDHDFESRIHLSEKRKLKKCKEMNFIFSSSENDYDAMHRLIVACRERKGFPLSMNAAEFTNMFERFPERYVAFTLKDKNRLIATAIGVKINDQILYNFLPADDDEYLAYSPMVMLKAGIYDYCREHDFKILDYGIGTVGGIKNEGLIRFKENMGGILSHKYTFEIAL